MTPEEISKLTPGIYRIYFNSGTESLAAIGKNPDSGFWLAPITSSPVGYHPWEIVSRVEKIDIPEKGEQPKPQIAPGNNPHGLTVEQVGVKDGWRLLELNEIWSRPNEKTHPPIYIWTDSNQWSANPTWGSLTDSAYRTKMPVGYFSPEQVALRAAPTQAKPEQPEAGKSDTPKTDAEARGIIRSFGEMMVPVDFARTLERENNELRAKVEKWKGEAVRLGKLVYSPITVKPPEAAPDVLELFQRNLELMQKWYAEFNHTARHQTRLHTAMAIAHADTSAALKLARAGKEWKPAVTG